jgi:hypothetical protein
MVYSVRQRRLTHEILVSLAFFLLQNLHVSGLFIPKKRVRAKKNLRLSLGVAGGFWTKFEAQLAQPLES